jgi:List-Bact-rpt repeat protein
MSGTGKGSVVNAQSGMACSADCSAPVALNTTISLQANPAEYSLFSGWSGACIGNGDCTLIMNADKAVTATFDKDAEHAVRIDTPAITYFATLIDAYLPAPSPAVIKAWGTDFTGDVTFGANKAIKICGGYNSGYTANTGKTVLRGVVRIRNGSVRVENLIVR